MKVLLTRRWPQAAEAAFAEQFDTTRSADDVGLSLDQLRASLSDYDVLCPTVSDRLPAALWDGATVRTRLIANYGAGTDHIDRSEERRVGKECRL